MEYIRTVLGTGFLHFTGRSKYLAILALPLALVLLAGCKPDIGLGKNVLAKIDSDVITVDDYKALYADDIPKELKDRAMLLDRMINSVLVSRQAHSEQMFTDPEVMSRLDDFNAKMLPNILKNDVAKQITVTDEELEKEFKKPAPVMEVSIISTSGMADADAAMAELKKGVPFGKVAEKYSVFKTDQPKEISLDDPLYPVGVRAALNSLEPGSISPVIKLEIGYCIFRLNGKKSSDQSWASMKEEKRKQLKEKKVNEAMEELTKKLWSEADIVTNRSLFKPGGDKSWGARVDGVTITLAPGLIDPSGDPHEPHQSMKPQSIMSTVEKMVGRYLLAKEARRRGLQKDPAFQRMLKFKSEEIMADIFLDRVKGNYTVTDAEVLEYYNKNKDKIASKKAYRISRILLNNEADAKKALGMIKSGSDFAAVAAAMSVDETTKGKGGDVGIVTTDDLKEPLKSVINSLKVGEVAGPVKTGYGYELLKATGMREAAVPPLDEVRESIRKRVLLTKQSQKVQEIISRLYKKSDVKINRELLKSM